MFLGRCNGLPQQLHLSSIRLESVKAEDVWLQDDVDRVLTHQLIVERVIIGLGRLLLVGVGHYYYRAWSPQLAATKSYRLLDQHNDPDWRLRRRRRRRRLLLLMRTI